MVQDFYLLSTIDFRAALESVVQGWRNGVCLEGHVLLMEEILHHLKS